VYIVSHPSHAYIKIGTTTSPKGRLATLQTGCPQRQFKYEALIHFPDRRAIERALHQLFGDARQPGSEWFLVTREDVLQALTNLSSTAIIPR
jgi:hypothetical protein